MSINLDQVLVTKFEQEVKQRFQEDSVLRNTVYVKDATGAKTVKFPLMGRGLAQERTNLQTPLPVMNISHQHITVNMKNFTASELTDIFLENQTNVDERMELVEAISMALGRTIDQLIIDALDAVSYGAGKQVGISIGGTNTNLNVAKISAAAAALDKDGVPSADRHLVIHTNGLHALLNQEKATSADYMNLKALVRGDIDTFYGFKVHQIGNRDEGGLPLATADRTCFAYHRKAVGMGLNMEPKIRIDWEPSYGAHRVTGYLSANAVVVDDLGAVEITTRDTAAAEVAQ